LFTNIYRNSPLIVEWFFYYYAKMEWRDTGEDPQQMPAENRSLGPLLSDGQ
jgi:hypothetical protein